MTRALVLADSIRGQNGTERLLGLQVVERVLVNLRSRGVEDIALLGNPAGLPQEQLAGVMLVEASSESAAIRSQLASSDDDLLVIAGDSVYHPDLPRLLPERAAAAGSSLAVLEQPGHPALLLRAADAERMPDAGTLYDLVTALVDQEVVRLVDDAAPLFVVPATDAAERRRAEDLLLALNWRPHDGLVARYINKHISVRISRRLADSFITPNLMTLGAAVIGLAGVLITAAGSYWTFLFGALLVQIQSILDGCDGELSRMRYQSSRVGAWLDTVVDDLLGVLWVTTIGIGLYRATGHWAYLLIGVAAGLFHAVGSGLVYAALIKDGGVGHQDFVWWFAEEDDAARAAAEGEEIGAAEDAEPAPTPAAEHHEERPSFFTYLIRRDFYVLLFVFLALFDLMPVALLFSAGGAAFLMTFAIIHVSKRGLSSGMHDRGG